MSMPTSVDDVAPSTRRVIAPTALKSAVPVQPPPITNEANGISNSTKVNVTSATRETDACEQSVAEL
jgi:hypothetical protein